MWGRYFTDIGRSKFCELGHDQIFVDSCRDTRIDAFKLRDGTVFEMTVWRTWGISPTDVCKQLARAN